MGIASKIAVLLLMLSSSIWAFSGAGAGTSEDPYQITNKLQLEEVNSDLAAHYILMNDIDLSSETYTQAVIAPNPDGDTEFEGAFFGTLDGNNHKIINFSLDGYPSINGFIGGLGETGVVEHLVLENYVINGSSGGALCGKSIGQIDHCSAIGFLNGGYYLAGICGHNRGEITYCSSTGTLVGDGTYIGGICARNSGGSVSNSYFDGDIEGRDRVGGLCGKNEAGVIDGCYSKGSVSGDVEVGGLTGYNLDGTITNCYSYSSAEGNEYVGGFCGHNSGNILTSFSIGDVSGLNFYGGFCGYNWERIVNCFWDGDACSQVFSSGGVSKTTLEMKDSSTYTGWNNGYWTINDNVDYPHLFWENTSGVQLITDYPARIYSGEGTMVDPFVISTSDELVNMGLRLPDWDSVFVLENNIDMSGVDSYHPVTQFGGFFDGHGYSVSNLSIDSELLGNSGQLGFIGNIKEGGIVKELIITGGSIKGQNQIGGLCGSNSGLISKCSFNGVVTGETYSGGLCGDNEGTLELSNSKGQVTSGKYSGGLCGYNNGSINDCYSQANVSGTDYVGGFCGLNRENIAYCYSNGLTTGAGNYIGGFCGNNSDAVSRSYWDIETSGLSSSSGATGLTTLQMQEEDSYIGWNFMGETYNESQLWYISADNYPKNLWEIASYTVVFEAGDFGAISSGEVVQTVYEGQNAAPPSITPLNGYTFIGWSDDYTNITVDKLLIAQYEEITYTVTFNSGNHGTITSGDNVQVIQYGLDAIAPEITPETGYHFVGWDKDYTNVTSDISATAIYKYNYSAGDGSASNPYNITNKDELDAINNELSAHYILVNDIDLSGNIYGQAVIAPDTNLLDGYQGTSFNGSFNGDGFGISGLTINGDTKDYVGLIGLIGSDGIVKNLKITSCNIVGYSYVGVVCGKNNGGDIYSCFSTGEIQSFSFAGGICGENNGIISDSYSTALIAGSIYLGGFCGYNSNVILNSYSKGLVDGGDSYVGGFCGHHYAGSISNCFWDIETSNQSASSGGVGSTTVGMMTKSTFTNSGWDFVDEDTNGVGDFWCMGESGYPELFIFDSDYQESKLIGAGTIDNPYLIYDKYDLVKINSYAGAVYSLQDDIDMTGIISSKALIDVFSRNIKW